MEFSEFKIISSGFYSSNAFQRGTSISKERTVTGFEIEFPIQSGGTLHINYASYPIAPNTYLSPSLGKPDTPNFLLRATTYTLPYLMRILIGCSNSIRIYDNSFYKDIIKKQHFRRTQTKLKT